MSVTANNPIMPGFYPDPSICAVGEDYYLVNSTFAYFPGLPVLHSRDLAHWEQIGNVLDRPSQLPLEATGHSRGLFAPTIRYHEGTFYCICTNVSYGGNFYVTAKDPAGPWSEPVYLEGADGIDPSLFFDTDGKCYYIGTHPNPDGCRYNGDYYIWIQELDLEQGKLVGEVHNVWNGAMKQIVWPEGPHLYKIGDYYYIMNAEGGTGPEHAETICRSKNLFGPYENNFCNPIITHRHLGKDYPIKYVGHGDLVQTPAGEWYMVMLAVRPLEGFTTMGRETFMAKVTWENDWPIVNVGVGMLTDTISIDLPEWIPEKSCCENDSVYDFTAMSELGPEFLALRRPADDFAKLQEGSGLELKYTKTTLREEATPSYLAIRQKHHHFNAECDVCTDSVTEGRAGIALVQSNEYHMRVELTKVFGTEQLIAEVILCENGTDRSMGEVTVANKPVITVGIRVDGLQASAHVDGITVTDKLDVRNLSTEVAGGFVGCTVGLYAVTDRETQASARFSRLAYTV